MKDDLDTASVNMLNAISLNNLWGSARENSVKLYAEVAKSALRVIKTDRVGSPESLKAIRALAETAALLDRLSNLPYFVRNIDNGQAGE